MLRGEDFEAERQRGRAGGRRRGERVDKIVRRGAPRKLDEALARVVIGIVDKCRGDVFADRAGIVVFAFGDSAGLIAEEWGLAEVGASRSDFGERVVELEVVPEDGGSLEVGVAV